MKRTLVAAFLLPDEPANYDHAGCASVGVLLYMHKTYVVISSCRGTDLAAHGRRARLELGLHDDRRVDNTNFRAIRPFACFYWHMHACMHACIDVCTRGVCLHVCVCCTCCMYATFMCHKVLAWVGGCHLCHRSLSLEMSLSRMGTRRSDIASQAPGQHVRVLPPPQHQLAAWEGDRQAASWRTHQSRRRASAAEDCEYLQTAHAPHTHGQRCRQLSLHTVSAHHRYSRRGTPPNLTS